MTQSAFLGAAPNGGAALSSSGATVPGNWGGAASNSNFTESLVTLNYRGSATLQNVRINVAANSWLAAVSFKTRRNGSNGNIAVSLTASTTGIFSDLTHTDAMSDGDVWDYTFAMGSSGSGSIYPTGVSAELVCASQAETMMQATWPSGTAVTGNNTTQYIALQGRPNPNATEALCKSVALEAATISHLQINVGTNTSSSAATVKSRKNGADGNQSISVTSGTTGIFEDTTHSDTLAATDLFNASILTGASSTTITALAVGVKYTGSTSARVMSGLCFPSSANITSGGTAFNGITGAATGNGKFPSTEASYSTPFPFAGSISNLAVYCNSNASSAAATFVLRKGGVNQTNTVSITASTTGLFRDVTHTDTLAAGDLITTSFSGQNGTISVNNLACLIVGPGAAGNAYTLTAASGSYSISGTAVALRQAHVLPAASGSYAITGTAAALKRGLRLTAGAGSYAIAGTAAAFHLTRVLAAGAGTYVITGTAAALKRALVLAAGAGSYSLTGTAAAFRRGLNLAAGAGAYTITGTAIAFRRGLRLAAGSGAYALTGTAVALKRALRLVAGPGAYAITGSAVSLIYTSAKTLAASAGSYVINGSAVALRRTRIMAAGAGSYAISGTATALKRGARMAAASGAYAVIGTSVALILARRLGASSGSYAVTGSTVAFRAGKTMAAGAGAYILTGSVLALKVGRRLVAGSGSYALTGAAVAMHRAITMAAGAGAYLLSGAAAAFLRSRRIQAGAGAYLLSGGTVSLQVQRRIAAAAGAYTLTGAPAGLYVTRQITASPGSYILMGADAALSRTHLNARPPPPSRTVTGSLISRSVTGVASDRTAYGTVRVRTV